MKLGWGKYVVGVRYFVHRQTSAKVHHRPCTGGSLCPAVCDSVARDREYEKEGRVDMKVKIAHRIFSLCRVAVFVR